MFRDQRIRDLAKELQEAEGLLADATGALKVKTALVKQQEDQLADKDAELATLNASRAAQQKLQRAGSAASTSHRSVKFEFQNCDDVAVLAFELWLVLLLFLVFTITVVLVSKQQHTMPHARQA